MVDIRSEHRRVRVERRKYPRLEFHCDADVSGVQSILSIINISLGGVFIEASDPDSINVGRTIMINTKLPSERHVIRLKAKVVRKTERGIGCQFIGLKEQVREAICTFLELFKGTLPVGCE